MSRICLVGFALLLLLFLGNSSGNYAAAGAVAGEISIGATMQPVEITRLNEKGDVKSAILPALKQPAVGTVPGPDVIVGDLIGLVQSENGSVTLAVPVAFIRQSPALRPIESSTSNGAPSITTTTPSGPTTS